jgi:hypothetical protein
LNIQRSTSKSDQKISSTKIAKDAKLDLFAAEKFLIDPLLGCWAFEAVA